MKDKLVSERWQMIITIVAIGVSAYAGVRGEMASQKAGKASADTEKVSKDAEGDVTAVLNLLNDRMERLEKHEQELRVYMASLDSRDKYFEKTVWDIYRRQRGVRAADRVVSEAPEKPAPPVLVSKKKKPAPRSVDAARQQYQKACDKGDPLCAVPLK